MPALPGCRFWSGWHLQRLRDTGEALVREQAKTAAMQARAGVKRTYPPLRAVAGGCPQFSRRMQIRAIGCLTCRQGY
jgi:hypothetical protein